MTPEHWFTRTRPTAKVPMELHPKTLPRQAVARRTADAPRAPHRRRLTAAQNFYLAVTGSLIARAQFEQTPHLNLVNYLGPHREIPKPR